MSDESLAVFHDALYDGETDLATLQAAAVQHVNCSRSLEDLTRLFAQATEDGTSAHEVNMLANELQSVRAAERVVRGIPARSS